METKAYAARKRNTERFLVQYEMRRRLENCVGDDEDVESSADDEAARDECARHIHPFDTEISIGDIRVMKDAERITYVLVADRWAQSSWLVIPFSNYSHPAFETELRMKADGGLYLRVAQLWNARSMTSRTLQKSWVACQLDAEQLADVQSAWKWTVGVAELNDDQLERTGLAIRRRDDVRIAYQDRELENFAKIDAEDMRREEWLANVHAGVRSWLREPFRKSSVFTRDYALAAAPMQKPVVADCKVDGFGGVVNVDYDPADCTIRLQVFGVDGNRSRDLDGWSVFASADEAIGEIVGGRFKCALPEGFEGSVALADLEGKVHPLVSRD